MPHAIDQRLRDLGLTLPAAPAPAASYVPYVISGNMVYVSGQISQGPGGLIKGTLGADLSTEQGTEAARFCALALLAQLRAACGGDFGRLRRVVKLTGFVNCAPDFTEQPKVINGASELLVEVLGEIGWHARSAVGAPSLPLGVAVEIEAIFEIA
ncbi:MAG: RidA family protein [Pararhodobacter sp.]